MKTWTIWQPHASLIAIGAKHDETSSRPAPKTLRPGDLLAIHAAKRVPPKLPQELTERICATLFIIATADWKTLCSLPRGQVLAIVRFTGCDHTEDCQPSENQRLMGDWRPGRWAWHFEVVTSLLGNPIPAKGQQGLWEWEPPAWLAAELAAGYVSGAIGERTVAK